MIKKLQRKFILINMSLVTLVLLITFASIIMFNYRSTEREWNNILHVMIRAKDIPEERLPEKFDVGTPPKHFDDRPLLFSLSFCVDVNEAGEILGSRTNNVEVTDEFMKTCASEVLGRGKQNGYLKEYSLIYLIQNDEDDVNVIKIAFVDVTRQIQAMQHLILILLLVFLLSLVAFFLISLFLSKLTIKPVEVAWEQQKQFIADASHELKTPLTVILANTGILLSHKDSTIMEEEKWIYYVKAEALRMKKLVEDMLFLAKSDMERDSRKDTVVNLSECVWSSILPFEPVAFERGIELKHQIADHIEIMGREAELKQLCAILMDNACKYVNQGGIITVTLKKKNDKIYLTVANTGDVIEQENLTHLFERFYRVDESRDRKEGGYGLGLSIAKSVVISHHGKITVDSSKKDGTIFQVVLPIK